MTRKRQARRPRCDAAGAPFCLPSNKAHPQTGLSSAISPQGSRNLQPSWPASSPDGLPPAIEGAEARIHCLDAACIFRRVFHARHPKRRLSPAFSSLWPCRRGRPRPGRKGCLRSCGRIAPKCPKSLFSFLFVRKSGAGAQGRWCETSTGSAKSLFAVRLGSLQFIGGGAVCKEGAPLLSSRLPDGGEPCTSAA